MIVSCIPNRSIDIRTIATSHFYKQSSKFDSLISKIKKDFSPKVLPSESQSSVRFSKFNRDFIKNTKYTNTLLGGYKGMFDNKVKQILPDEKQYPYEQFYLDRKAEL